ncbi:MAG: hypothetical protein BWY72_02232 [Bacteroidetes bacterium ADurb.Bin416]|nr:MAG: hypothetical protein BWY72_02232 [Bacteroidetes bacterium ADurb.Bin416]
MTLMGMMAINMPNTTSCLMKRNVMAIMPISRMRAPVQCLRVQYRMF